LGGRFDITIKKLARESGSWLMGRIEKLEVSWEGV